MRIKDNSSLALGMMFSKCSLFALLLKMKANIKCFKHSWAVLYFSSYVVILKREPFVYHTNFVIFFLFLTLLLASKEREFKSHRVSSYV